MLPDPPPKRKGGSGEYTPSHYGLAIAMDSAKSQAFEVSWWAGCTKEVCKGVMSKAKWFAVKKSSIGEIIATSANQIVPPKIRVDLQTIFTRGGSGDETKATPRVNQSQLCATSSDLLIDNQKLQMKLEKAVLKSNQFLL